MCVCVWKCLNCLHFHTLLQGGRSAARKTVETGTQDKDGVDYQWVPDGALPTPSMSLQSSPINLSATVLYIQHGLPYMHTYRQHHGLPYIHTYMHTYSMGYSSIHNSTTLYNRTGLISSSHACSGMGLKISPQEHNIFCGQCKIFIILFHSIPPPLSREKPQTFSSAKKSKEIVSIDSVSSLFYDEGGSCHFDLLSLSLSVRKSCSFFITTPLQCKA